MKKSELKVGMEVGVKRSYMAPVKAIVVIVGITRYSRYGGYSLGGRHVGVAVPYHIQGEDGTNWLPKMVALNQILGPYDKAMKEYEAEEEEKHRRYERRMAAKEAQAKEMEFARARLEKVLGGPLVLPTGDGYLRLTCAQVHQLLDMVGDAQ